jgi:hypothetical protein
MDRLVPHKRLPLAKLGRLATELRLSPTEQTQIGERKGQMGVHRL